jgi:ParB-like chromosome segregation protein Spo0J
MGDTNHRQINYVGIDDIKQDATQPRKVFSEAHIRELSENIKTIGLVNPVELDSNMVIITGERRWRAAKLAGWTEIPVIINTNPMTPYERLRRQMSENLLQSSVDKSETMNPLDIAQGYSKLLELRGYKVPPGGTYAKSGEKLIEELSKEIGIAKTTIYEHLELLDQPKYVQEDIHEGRPRTYYRAANQAPENLRETIKEKVSKGEYKTRKEILEDVALAKRIPELATLEIERKRAKESVATNKILNAIAKLGIALEHLSISEIAEQEKHIVLKQLQWIYARIKEYIGE